MKRIPRGLIPTRPTLPAALPPTRLPRFAPAPKLTVARQTRTLSRLGRQSGPVQVQHVAVRKRRFTLKRLLTFSLASGLGITFVAFLVASGFLLLDDEEEDGPAADLSLVADKVREANGGDALGMEGAQGSAGEGEGAVRRPTRGDGKEGEADEEGEGEEEEEEDDILPEHTPDDAWFIPLGPVKKMPREDYKGSDPEWQEFVKFSKDRQRQIRVRKELQAEIQRLLLREAKVTRILGKDVRVRRSWLDLNIPRSAPQEYEQLGIEWASDYIAVGYRTRPSHNVRRAQLALWPEAVAVSAYSTAQELVQMQYNKALEAMGLKDAAAKPSQHASSLSSINGEHKATNQKEQTQGHPAGQAGSGGKSGAKDETKAAQDALLSTFTEQAPGAGVRGVVTLFERKLSRLWMSPSRDIPRGTVILQGLVEYEGSQGVCVMAIVAGYSVMTNELHIARAKIQSISPHKITPRR